MSVILVLVAFSVTLAIGFLVAFFWSVRNGQYDDTYGDSVRILFEDEKPDNPTEAEPNPGDAKKDQSPNQ